MTGLAGDVQTDQLSGSFARRPDRRPLGRVAGSGTLRGAGEEGQEEGHGNPKESRRQVLSDSSSDDSEADSSREDEEEKKEASSPAGGETKRKASPTREAGGTKKGRTFPSDYSTDADDGGEEWPPRAKPLAKS